MNNDDFRLSWHQVVATWSGLTGQAAADVLSEVLENGLPAPVGEALEVTASQLLRCETALVRLSGAVDRKGYLQGVPDLPRDAAPVAHFCRWGWRRFDNPSREFDVWWYWHQYLDRDNHDVNPLVHYLVRGRRVGFLPLPPAAPPREPTTLTSGQPVRRVVLFAAYDVDGLVDDYVVAYLAELSRFADVYYLADCEMASSELDKLATVTVGAWASRHETYDFGSYSLLARDLVGWEVIDGYDELLLVNDSAYLLTPLDEVFERMDARPCDWWGLQATKRDYEAARGDVEPLPLVEAKARYRGQRTWQQIMHLHISSYFIALRRPAHSHPDVRELLSDVTKAPSKGQVILRYEVGLSRVLMDQGFDFDTFIDDLYPYHPLYTSDYFSLLQRHFPLLKRNLLSHNPRNAPGLSRWKERVLELAPSAPVDVLERNLLRVSPDDALQGSFAVVTGDDGSVVVPRPLSGPQMERQDERTPTYDHWWAFPVCAYDHTFAGNERAVFEQIRDDPSIKKIVLTRSRRVDVTGENVVVAPLRSPEGQQLVLRAGQIFVKHAPRINVPFPLSTTRHNFINLWHGIPLKRFGWAAHATEKERESVRQHHVGSRAVITSSKIDTLAMAAAFHPLTLQDMWPTGLPRNDFILRREELLPPDLRVQEQRLRDEVAGRRLVMFLPTFKSGQASSYYTFSSTELERLRDWSQRNGAVIGVREHMADRAHTYSRMLSRLDTIDLSSRRFPDLEVLYRVADALVTDYSSCLVDFMLTGKPVISFAYDYDRYDNEERGLFYDLEDVVPGPVCRDFPQFADALDQIFDPPTPAQLEDYAWKRTRFFDHLDDDNAARVVERVKKLYVSGL